MPPLRMLERRYHCVGTPRNGPTWRSQGWGPTAQIAFLRALDAAECYIEYYNPRTGPVDKWKFKTVDRKLEMEVILMTNRYIRDRYSRRF